MASAHAQVVEEAGIIVPVRVGMSGVLVLTMVKTLNEWYKMDEWCSRPSNEQKLQDESFPE